MLTLLLRQSGAALRMLLAATVVLGLVYPLAVWGVSRLPGLNGSAEGSVLTAPDGAPVGSSLIGIDPVPTDPAADPYFHTRPSASAEDVLGPRRPVHLGRVQPGRVLREAARPGRAAPGRDRRPRGRRTRGRAGGRGH
jgi:K+-transporting ATPase ATPase C chain